MVATKPAKIRMSAPTIHCRGGLISPPIMFVIIPPITSGRALTGPSFPRSTGPSRARFLAATSNRSVGQVWRCPIISIARSPGGCDQGTKAVTQGRCLPASAWQLPTGRLVDEPVAINGLNPDNSPRNALCRRFHFSVEVGDDILECRDRLLDRRDLHQFPAADRAVAILQRDDQIPTLLLQLNKR